MTTLLITGGTGFVGRYILDVLDTEFSERLEYNTIRLMVRTPSKAEKINLDNYEVEVVEGDLLNPVSIKEATTGVDAVIHVAALYDTSSPRDRFFRANVDGTEVLLNSLNEGTPVVLTSTYGVYGFDTPDEPISENYEPKKPFWHYQESKKAQEDLAFDIAASKGLRLTAIRPPTVFGPGDYFFVPGVIEGIREGNVALLREDGANTIPFAHPYDVAKAHLLALEKIDIAEGNQYHLASFHPKFKEIIDKFSTGIGEGEVTRSVPYRLAYFLGWLSDKTPLPLPLTRFEVMFLGSNCILDTSAIEEDLDWEATKTMEETVDQTLTWYQTEEPQSRA